MMSGEEIMSQRMKSLTLTMLELSNCPEYQDVRIICQNGTFHSSRVMLAIMFPTFLRILPTMDCDETIVIFMPDMDISRLSSIFQSFAKEEDVTADSSLLEGFPRSKTTHFKFDIENETEIIEGDMVQMKDEIEEDNESDGREGDCEVEEDFPDEDMFTKTTLESKNYEELDEEFSSGMENESEYENENTNGAVEPKIIIFKEN